MRWRISGDIITPAFLWAGAPHRIGQETRGAPFSFPRSSWLNYIICPSFFVAVLRVMDGIVFRSHRQLDFALLWLLADGPFPFLPFGNPQNLRHAQTVLAIGAPAGLSKTVTKGIVSNPKQLFRLIECIQTDAAIDQGNSGGPLVGQDGVIGITLWGLGNVDSAKFVVPIDYLIEDIVEAVRKGRKACLDAVYCPACGYSDDGSPVWYCQNCGVEFEKESETDQKDA